MSMQSILSASLSLSRVQTMQSVQTQTQGRVSVLKAEIKQDGGHDERKEAQIEELNERSGAIMENLNSELQDVNHKLGSEEEEETQTSPPNTDSVDLEKPAEEQTREGAPVLKGDAEAYDAKGKPVSPHPTGQTVDEKA